MSIFILEQELSSSTIFKDRSKLSIEYVPSALPHRENEYRLLAQYFRPVLEDPKKVSSRVLIRGKVGTGKTVLTKRFGLDFESLAHQSRKNIVFVHINCREVGTFYGLLRRIIGKFEGIFPRRGLSSEEGLEILLDILDSREAHLILALDELESLIRREGPLPLYNLLRVQEARIDRPARISVICIFRDPECEDVIRFIDRSTLSTLEPNTIYLKEYTTEELRDILEQRVREAFKEGTVKPESIYLISEIAAEYGDARYAIELLERSGLIADLKRSSYLLPSHVREAKAEISPGFEKELLLSLGLHEKLILLALARYLEQIELGYLTMGDLREQYCIACEEYGRRALGYTSFWKRLKNLADLGLISAKTSGKGFRGRTTLVGLLVPADKLRQEIEGLLRG